MSSESVAVPALSRVGAPLFCNLIVSHRCFFKCQMCLNWKAPEADKALSFEECKKFVDGLSQFIDYKLDINIMGGEPLMLDWILPLCNYMYEKGFASIMSTNGYLIDETKAQEIADSRLEFLGLSLDGLKPHTHDTIRGMSGSHARIMSAIANLEARCKRPFSITFLTLILESNLGELPELVKWLSQPGGIHKEVSFTALLECGLVKDKEGWFRQAAYKHLWPQDPGKVSGVIDELIALKKQGHKIVNPVSQLEAFKEYYRDPEKFLRETEYCIHDYIIDLDPSSEILLSGHPLGSLKNSHDLKELWFSEKANQIRRYIDEYGCDSSRSCLINFLCAFPPDGDDQLDHYGNLAFFYQVRGKYDQSLLHFKKALIRNPRNANLHLGVAYSYFKLKDYRASVDAYDRAFGLKPDLRKDREIMSDYQKTLEGALQFYTQRRRDLYR